MTSRLHQLRRKLALAILYVADKLSDLASIVALGIVEGRHFNEEQKVKTEE
jgi:hypothetical protein